ncbi:curli production assembly protein CsgG [Asaia sp. W19]|uniref:CsgG/HfaB family protein n=1 Tax=unclassified Asaia TaxID=2685023 RepID=UPI000F8D8200|nr:CsgG/HfaB family protein [Asaia sp. W19]RUT26272.1 curli production assembly protein CsgG [Asaia sp. W19]RUT27511.1 curli production assembly protein CsgG [Asaia sp. W19]
MRIIFALHGILASTLLLSACATESSRTLPVPPVQVAQTAYNGPRVPIAAGKFANRSNYMNGIFSDGIDRLGNQARTILLTRLQQSGRFSVMDRDNLAEGKQEAGFLKQGQSIQGAQYLVTGDVTAFGRKEVGDMQLFGIAGRGHSQIAYAKVSLQIVNPLTSQIVATSEGSAEYSLSDREVIGFGSTASYDSTLNGKVLDLAIQDAVNHFAQEVDSGQIH